MKSMIYGVVLLLAAGALAGDEESKKEPEKRGVSGVAYGPPSHAHSHGYALQYAGYPAQAQGYYAAPAQLSYAHAAPALGYSYAGLNGYQGGIAQAYAAYPGLGYAGLPYATPVGYAQAVTGYNGQHAYATAAPALPVAAKSVAYAAPVQAAYAAPVQAAYAAPVHAAYAAPIQAAYAAPVQAAYAAPVQAAYAAPVQAAYAAPVHSAYAAPVQAYASHAYAAPVQAAYAAPVAAYASPVQYAQHASSAYGAPASAAYGAPVSSYGAPVKSATVVKTRGGY